MEVFYELTSLDELENKSIFFLHLAKNTAQETAKSVSDLLKRRHLLCRSLKGRRGTRIVPASLCRLRSVRCVRRV